MLMVDSLGHEKMRSIAGMVKERLERAIAAV
jgi:hypothetical protein